MGAVRLGRDGESRLEISLGDEELGAFDLGGGGEGAEDAEGEELVQVLHGIGFVRFWVVRPWATVQQNEIPGGKGQETGDFFGALLCSGMHRIRANGCI